MLSAETIRRIWCDTTVTRLELRDGIIVEIEQPGRLISAALRRALGLRDSQCRFPGCCAKRVDAHHIRYRRHKGPTTLENLLSLCRFHHKLVHEGGYTIGRKPTANYGSTTHEAANSTTAANSSPTTAPTPYDNNTETSASTSAPTPSSATIAATNSTCTTQSQYSPHKTSPQGQTPPAPHRRPRRDTR